MPPPHFNQEEEDIKTVAICCKCGKYLHDFRNDQLYGRCMIEEPHQTCACALSDPNLCPEEQVAEFLRSICCIWGAASTIVSINEADELFEEGMHRGCDSCPLGEHYMMGGCNSHCCRSLSSFCLFSLMEATADYQGEFEGMTDEQWEIMRSLITDGGTVMEPHYRDEIDTWLATGEKPSRDSEGYA